jgi:ABC-type antimicrobial peptide transport system permease subunit
MQFNAGYPTLDLKTTWTVVGVVDDVRQRSLSVAAEPAYYASHGQGTPNRQAIVVHAASGDSEALRSAIRAEVRKIDPQIPVEFERLADFVRSTISRQELGMTLMLGFGAAAIALAAIGIYGVIAYSAAQQRNEMAIRLALGATSQNVFWLTVRQGRTLALVGSAIGVVVAYVSGRLVSNWLFEVRASDPFILGAATLLVIVIAIVATVIPAYRAAQLEPARVLRPET